VYWKLAEWQLRYCVDRIRCHCMSGLVVSKSVHSASVLINPQIRQVRSEASLPVYVILVSVGQSPYVSYPWKREWASSGSIVIYSRQERSIVTDRTTDSNRKNSGRNSSSSITIDKGVYWFVLIDSSHYWMISWWWFVYSKKNG